jgi:hypothetical protein
MKDAPAKTRRDPMSVLAFHASRLKDASPDDWRVYIDSAVFSLLALRIGHFAYTPAAVEGGAPTLGYDVERTVQAARAPLTCVADHVVRMSVQRAMPWVRFDITNYLVVKHHFDDLDRDGVPRTSCDGYANV